MRGNISVGVWEASFREICPYVTLNQQW